MLYIRDLIRKKRNREMLTKAECDFFIYSYNRDEILKEQAASLLTLMYTNGLYNQEMKYLSEAIAETGEKRKLYELSNKMVDIHPIGGMDDKIIIILLAILNALNLPAVKVVGREISILDKLIGARIYKANLENMGNIGASIDSKQITIIEEPNNTAPVEHKLYKLRNDIACNDDVSLIAINLMSPKIALGVRNMVFDISYGEKAFVKTYKDAERLARYLIQMGQDLNKGVKCIITKLEEPVGTYFGNTLELKEVAEALKGHISSDVLELVLEIGNCVLSIMTGNHNSKFNKKMIMNALKSDQAYNCLNNMIKENGGKLSSKPASHIIAVTSSEKGYIESVDMSVIRSTAQYIHAVRHKREDKLDVGAGIEISKKIGDKVEIGEIIGYIHTNDETRIQQAVQNLKQAFIFNKSKIKKESRITKVI